MPTPAEIQFREVVQAAAHQIRKSIERGQKVAEYEAIRRIQRQNNGWVAKRSLGNCGRR